ncbi:hypothetical protein ACJ73_05759 [Blastomyces percursus]|uniref:SprT-like domain-containing protein n=1 Tax=Blastomyces percursus TaxID=1658174 RepID=A0A1J9Q2W7_9EURO|nr:hypothetical protein ACJ73_05759 [Blastomyces percursus]
MVESSENEEEEEEAEEEETDEFDSLDDFIVGDDEDLSYFDESNESSLTGSDGDEDGDEEEENAIKPRSSPRKLFRGLRPTPASITPKALFRDRPAADIMDTATAGVGGGGGDVNSHLPVNDVKAGSNRSTTPHSLFDSSSDDSEDDSDEKNEVILSLPKKFDLKLTGSKQSSSPKKNKGIGHRALGGSMDGSQPLSASRSGESEDRTAGIVTPPSSPSKPRLYSPSKSKSRIPPTPHRPSIDAFWSQDIINEWNDQYSPRKKNTPRRGLERFHIYSDNEDDSQGTMSNRSSTSPQLSPSKSPVKGSPLKKAAAAAAAAAKKALAAQRKEFDEKKVQIAEEFFKALDDAVTGGEIQKLAAATGGVKIIWSKTLNTTAGRANWKRETVRQKPLFEPIQQHQMQSKQVASSLSASGYHEGKTSTTTTAGSSKSTPTGATSSSTSASTSTSSKTNTIPLTPALLAPINHHASIELASKVIDSEDRLLNTLAHEYCHLANFMISNVRNNPHGTSFKQWAARCERALAAHPVYGCAEGGTGTKPKIRITTKHSYVIHYKYLWSCVQCGHEYGRHSRSIDVKKSRCGRCKVGELAQVRPKPRGVKGKVVVGGGVKGMGVSAVVDGVTKSMGGVHLGIW